MNTTSDFGAGHLAASALDNPGELAPSRILDHHLLRPWRYRHMLRSPLIQPFNKLLRPLVRWFFTKNWITYDAANGEGEADVKLKPLTIAMFLLAMILAPLVFIMLLPLILILLPLAIVFGILGLAATTAKTDDDELEHHSLTWHVIH